MSKLVILPNRTAEAIFAHARQANPYECCGLVGGTPNGQAQSVYQLRNVAERPTVSYEAAPEDLFCAQREMRQRNEQLLAIYHSHPRSVEPRPSETDVRLAFYPSAIHLIVGLAGDVPIMRAFTISEREMTWQPVEYEIADE